MSMSLLAGCGTFVCDGCKKESDGEKHEITVNDKEFVVCDDCKKSLDEGF